MAQKAKNADYNYCKYRKARMKKWPTQLKIDNELIKVILKNSQGKGIIGKVGSSV